VGFTRARKNLYVTHAVSRMQYGQPVSNAPRRFIKEVPKEYIETVNGGGRKEYPPSGGRDEYSISGGGSRSEYPHSGGYRGEQRRGGVSGTDLFSPGKTFSNPYLSGTGPKNAPPESPRGEPAPPPDKKTAYKVGGKVKSPAYGAGTIIAIRERKGEQELSVAFDGAGIKKFMAHMANLQTLN
jgi:DNA helicase-2/ATP-dependent DNA helicase PcrA